MKTVDLTKNPDWYPEIEHETLRLCKYGRFKSARKALKSNWKKFINDQQQKVLLAKVDELEAKDLFARGREAEKKRNPAIFGVVLGEWIEFFNKDAEHAAKAFGLRVTRDRQGSMISGFPVHALADKLQRMKGDVTLKIDTSRADKNTKATVEDILDKVKNPVESKAKRNPNKIIYTKYDAEKRARKLQREIAQYEKEYNKIKETPLDYQAPSDHQRQQQLADFIAENQRQIEHLIEHWGLKNGKKNGVDAYTKTHLKEWIKKHYTGKDQRLWYDRILRYVTLNPELIDQNRSWPEIQKMAASEFEYENPDADYASMSVDALRKHLKNLQERVTEYKRLAGYHNRSYPTGHLERYIKEVKAEIAKREGGKNPATSKNPTEWITFTQLNKLLDERGKGYRAVKLPSKPGMQYYGIKKHGELIMSKSFPGEPMTMHGGGLITYLVLDGGLSPIPNYRLDD